MVDESASSERVEEAAVQWFVRQQSEAWTETDQAELDAWLEAATAHRVQYLRVSTTWNHAARLKALGAGVAAGIIPPRGAWGDTRFFKGTAEGAQPADSLETSGVAAPTDRRRRVWLKSLTIAASVLVAVAVTNIFNARTDYLTGEYYTTKVGGLNSVPLADGSNVTLNTDTSIRVALADDERRIRLEKGEAFFEIARDEARPFVVYAGDKRVVAVGTKFSVRRDGDDVQVVVTEGRVRLAEANEPLTLAAAAPSKKPRATFLDAGTVARVSGPEVVVDQTAGSRTEQMLAWRTGYVSFQDTPLAEAVDEFNRYTTRKIIIEDPAIAEIRVGGNFRSNNTAAFLDLLHAGFPISVDEREDRVLLSHR